MSTFFRVTGEIRDLEYTFTRSELERICDHFVEQGVGRILELLSKACMDPASIAICLATGGMVNMPMIKSRLREIFGPQRLHISERGNTVIAERAAWIAHAKRRLTLAKNVELSVAGNSYFPLVKAGTSMPREGEVQRDMFNLYCTDPRNGVAKFQFSSPVVPGRAFSTDPRKILDNFSIKVHKEARPYLERLRLDVSIDDNLILKASAFSTMQRDIDEIEIHDLEFGLSALSRSSPRKKCKTRHGRSTSKCFRWE
jgi:molecular chaperone DnaK